MARLASKLITKQMPWHANMTDTNHLGKALIAKPQVFEGPMTELFTAKNYSDNPMTTILSQEAKEEEITSSNWEWSLKTATSRPLIVVENVEPASNTTPGKYRRPFKIKLDEDWYVPGDIIHPGTSNKKWQLRIQEEAQRHGKGFVYTVVLMTNNAQESLPVQYLRPNQQWSKLFSQYEEGGEQSGSTQYSLPISLSNKLSRFRKTYKITGDAHNEVLAVKIPDSKGRMHNTWIKYAEVEYWQQWYKELERGYWYSRSTDQVKGANGRPIYSGPGILEQLEDSHRHTYTHLTAKLIEEFLMDVLYSRIKPGSQRKIKGFAGEWGMILFHRAVQDWMSKKGFIQVVDSLFIDKTKSQYHDNALVAGYQFVKYRMANGIELELIHNPLYDDRTINYEIDPVTGYPLESMRITFLDFSGDGEKSNIKRMKKKGGMSLAYVAGLVSPYGPVNDGLASHSGDYYEMHVKDQCGLHIEDITRCGELICGRNQII